jgi:2-polyprenyl-3-methyl-5-hydroxy-6-metoxy-1,4-benzoquinol methylase
MDTPFTDFHARASWNKGARAFDRFVESGADYYRHEVHGPALLAACGAVVGRRALDLGCGQGFFARQLAKAGARVTAIDLSDDLIALAREHEAQDPLGIEYRVLSAATIGREWTRDSFDLVTACMSLQDMADAGGALEGAAAVLTAEGRMVFSVPHPCTDTPFREWDRDWRHHKRSLKIDRYFDTGPAVCNWNMPRLIYPWDTPCWRRTFSEWSKLIRGAGFLIQALHEPRPTEEQVKRNPKLKDCYRLPYFLIFDLIPLTLLPDPSPLAQP